MVRTAVRRGRPSVINRAITPRKEMSSPSTKRMSTRSVWCTWCTQHLCSFPFNYKDVEDTKCTSIDVYQPWCATEFNTADNLIGGWGLCLEDCEYEEPIVSCLEPPPVPQFGIRNDSGMKYLLLFSSELPHPFSETYIHTHYKVTRANRVKFYQPWIPYDSISHEDTNKEFIAESTEDDCDDFYFIS